MSSPGLRSSLGYGTGRGYKKRSPDDGGDPPVGTRCPNEVGAAGPGNKRNPEGASTNLHPLGALTSHQVEPEGPTYVGLRHCSEDLCRRPPSPRDSLSPKAVGCLSVGSTTRRSPAGSILSDPAGETAVLLLRVDPHARSEVSLRPCGACRFPSKHKRNVDHEMGLEFEFGFPNFASG
jgi:hypothetical protein